MFIYALEDKKIISAVALTNPDRYDIGETVQDILDKLGPKTTIIISNTLVTDPITELLGAQSGTTKTNTSNTENRI